MKKIGARLAVTMGLFLASFSLTSEAQTLGAIKGTWRSEGVENYGAHFALRKFVFGDNEWQVTYQTFADAAASQPMFTIRVKGYFALGEPSSKVADAVEGVFPARSRTLTAESEATVKLFADMGCQLKVGVEKALINTGCGFVPGVMQVMGEYDLVSLKNGKLFLGDRAGDLSKARPEKLTPYGLIKVQ